MLYACWPCDYIIPKGAEIAPDLDKCQNLDNLKHARCSCYTASVKKDVKNFNNKPEMKLAAVATDCSLTVSVTELLNEFFTIYFNYSLTRELRNTFLPQLKVAQIIFSDIVKDNT